MPPAPQIRSVASYVSDNVFDGTRPLTAGHATRLHAIAHRHTKISGSGALKQGRRVAASASTKRRTKRT
jgi:hypothetical protein